jgi:hypothetical protein
MSEVLCLILALQLWACSTDCVSTELTGKDKFCILVKCSVLLSVVPSLVYISIICEPKGHSVTTYYNLHECVLPFVSTNSIASCECVNV